MIGNDVVDLRRALEQSNWKRTGFLAKVYSDTEQKIIKEATDRNLMVWLLWSMKEAAYKAHQRAYKLPRQLNWKDQQCSIVSFNLTKTRGLVWVKGTAYSTTTTISSEYIHTTATRNPDLKTDTFCKLDTGRSIKIMFLKLISKHLHLPVRSLHLEKNSDEIPSVFYRGKEVFTRFSFSGHGRFYALSLELTYY